jgi:cobalt-zinc-cadmium efflux system outer membrane protein
MLRQRTNCGGGGSRVIRRFPIAVIALATACTARDYHAEPIEPATVLATLEARSADTQDVRSFLAANAVDTSIWPLPKWSLESLALLAIHLHPDLGVARAEWHAKLAAEATAAVRKNPIISPLVEYHSEPGADDTPWSVGLALEIPINAADKLAAQVAEAEALSTVARLEIGAIAWTVRGRVRDRFIALFAAQARTALAARQIATRELEVTILERRHAAGETDAITVGHARLALQEDRLRLSAAHREANVRKIDLADALTLPAEAVSAMTIGTDALSVWSPLPLAPNSVRRRALLNRLDVRAALAAYQATDSRLRLEIANQYPDIRISPGLLWDQGDMVWSVGGALLAPVLDINQGPIEHAERARELSARQLTALQSRVLGHLDRALAAYAAADDALDAAQALWHALNEHLDRVHRQFAAGETGRIAVLQSELALHAAGRTVLAERVNALRALGAVEDAVQSPLGGGPALPAVTEEVS